MVFELHGRVVNIAVGVVLAENSESLLISLLCDQPTRRFRDEEDEDELDDGGECLTEGGNTP